MAETSPIDAARLRAAVADRRYWQAGHPERAAWRGWVSEGFQALYGEGAQPNGGVVQVRAYVRDGQTVAARTRAAPVGAGGRRSSSDTERSVASKNLSPVW